MSRRISQFVLLCEDDAQERLVRSYLNKAGVDAARTLRVRNASREVHGGNVTWVLNQFPEELRVCRQRSIKARTLLITVADADALQVNERRAQLTADPPPSPADPVVILIPRRNVETWLKCALGDTVDEVTDYKPHRDLDKSEINRAAAQIHGWARNVPAPPATCVQSLRNALPDWLSLRPEAVA